MIWLALFLLISELQVEISPLTEGAGLAGNRTSAGAMDSRGERILYLSSPNSTAGASIPRANISLYLIDQKKPLRLTHTRSGEALYPVLSGDGKVVYFIFENGELGDGMFRLSIADGVPQRVWADSRGARPIEVSYKGDKVLVRGSDGIHWFVLDDSGNQFPIPDEARSASMDAPGKKLVYSRRGELSDALITLDLVEGTSRELLRGLMKQHEVRIFELSLSAGGKKLAFLSNLDTGSNKKRRHQLFLYDLGNEDLVQITRARKELLYSPQISGDGESIVFYAGETLLAGAFRRWLPTGRSAIFFYSHQDGSTVKVGAGDCDCLPGLNISHDGGVLGFSTNCLTSSTEQVYLARIGPGLSVRPRPK